MDSDRVVSLSGKISIEDEKPPAIIVDKMWEFSLDEVEQKTPVAPVRARETAAAPTEKTDAEKRLWLNISTMEDEDIDELFHHDG